MLEKVAFTMYPVKGARRAQVTHASPSRRSLVLATEGRSLGLHELTQP